MFNRKSEHQKLTALGLAGIALLAFTSCGKNQSTIENVPEPAALEEVAAPQEAGGEGEERARRDEATDRNIGR